jgi:ATP-dependent DNA helicase RecG
MNGVQIIKISAEQVTKILRMEEGHFVDLKSINISPAKLTRALAALSNAEGGELFIGIEENRSTGKRTWRGFKNPEAANSHIQTFEQLFPLGDDYRYEFLSEESAAGLVLKVQIAKTRDIKKQRIAKFICDEGPKTFPSKIRTA